MAGYQAGRAANVGVKDDVALLRITRQNPVVQRHGLLCRVDFLLLVLHVPLEHPVPHEAEYAGGAVKAGPCQFTIRKGPVRLVLLVPHDPALRILPDLHGKVIPAPNDLILRYAEQLPEVFSAGLFLPPKGKVVFGVVSYTPPARFVMYPPCVTPPYTGSTIARSKYLSGNSCIPAIQSMQ